MFKIRALLMHTVQCLDEQHARLCNVIFLFTEYTKKRDNPINIRKASQSYCRENTVFITG